MLKETLSNDLKDSMKSRDQHAVRAIRMLQTELRYREIAVNRDLTPEEEIQCVRSALKKHRESIEQFRDGGREELVEKEEAEAAVVERYLPTQLGEQELLSLIDTVINELQAGPRDFGKVMKETMSRVAGKADGAAVKQAVQSRLR
jgi:uncharacterized protein YqeY